MGEDAASDAGSGFDDGNANSGLGESPRGGEPGDAGSNHDDVEFAHILLDAEVLAQETKASKAALEAVAVALVTATALGGEIGNRFVDGPIAGGRRLRRQRDGFVAAGCGEAGMLERMDECRGKEDAGRLPVRRAEAVLHEA
jgi:hypothetical protein